MQFRSLRLLASAFTLFFAPAWLVAQEQLTLTPLHPSGIYDVGQKAGWTIELSSRSAAPTGNFTYTLKKNNFDVIASGVLEFSSGQASITTTLDEPSMLYLEVMAPGSEKSPTVAGAAIAPTQLQPSVPRPADFDAFWESKIKLLHSMAAEPIHTVGESEREGIDYLTLKLKNIHGAHVYGQLAKPARKGKFPAILILQWAGGPYPLEKQWVIEKAADGWLALNIEPHDVPGDLPPAFYAALPAMIKSYNTIGNDNRDRNYFLQMYLGAYRAVDYLASRPDWDGKILLVQGTSMGGQQSLAVAGLHPKITHLIVHVPAGADTNAALHRRAGGYPFWDMSDLRVRETAPYFDTVNFASRIKACSLVSMGFLDNVCPPAGIWTAFNQISAHKEVVPLANAAHNHQATAEQQKAFTDRSDAWLAALVKGNEPSLNAPLSEVP